MSKTLASKFWEDMPRVTALALLLKFFSSLIGCTKEYPISLSTDASKPNTEQTQVIISQEASVKKGYALETLTNEEINKLVSEGKAVNYNAKIPFDLDNFRGYEILYDNPTDGAVFSSDELNIAEIILNRFYINGKRFPVQKDNSQTLGSDKHYRLNFKDYEILPHKGWIVAFPSKSLYTDNLDVYKIRTGNSTVLDIDFFTPYGSDSLLDTGIIRIREKISAFKFIYTLYHELDHLLVDQEEPTPKEVNKQLLLSNGAQKWLNELKNAK